MKMKFICICTPSRGMVSIEWANTLRGLIWPMNTGYCSAFRIDSKGGEIAETRNRCVVDALAHESDSIEVTHLFWLDDDVIPHKLAVKAMMRHERPIVSGVYFTKEEFSEPLIFPGRTAGTSPFVPDRAYEVWGHGMGLTLVNTEVYRRMAREMDLGEDRYGRPQWYRTQGFAPADESGVESIGITEDLYFLDKAARLGYRSYIDTSRHAFGWHYDATRKKVYPRAQWAQQMAGEPITWQTPDGPVEWE